MSNRNEGDDGLYDLIDMDDNFDDGSNTCRTEDLLFNATPIDWNRMKVISESSKQNIVTDISENRIRDSEALKLDNNNCSSSNLKVSQGMYGLSARSMLINKRAEENMNVYLPHNMKKNSFNSGANSEYFSCSECGGRNTTGVGWCLFCGVLLIESEKKVNGNCKDDTNLLNEGCTVIDTTHLYNGAVRWRHMDVEEIDGKGRERIETRGVKLDLGGLESVRSNKMDDWDFDLEIGDDAPILSNSVCFHQIDVPPLDLSNLDSSRQINIKPLLNDQWVSESKENCNKATRKWASSSTAWIDIPQSVLNKKPSTFYRNKLNSCTNKIGITVYRAGMEDDCEDIPQKNRPFNRVSIEESIVIPDRPSSAKKIINCTVSSIMPDRSIITKNGLHTTHSMIASDSSAIIKNGLHYPESVVSPDRSTTIKNGLISPEPVIMPERPPIIIGVNHQDDLLISQWHCLPAEIWIMIMSYLNHHQLSCLQQSCRRLYSVGLDPSLWRIVTLYRHSNLSNAHILCIAKKTPKELHFKNCFGTNVTSNGLVSMFKICGEGLRKISFISCSKGAFEDDLFLELSAIFCPNVTHINASYLMNFRDETLKKMIESFVKIESLNIMGAHSISNQSIKSLVEFHRTSLINLDLYGCFKLNSATLVLLEECLNLKSLALGSIINLKRNVLIDMLRKLSQLSILDLRGTTNLVDDALLEKICQSCPKLQQIILTNSCRLTDHGVICLSKSCVSKTLKVLDICGCSKITEKGLEEVLKQCKELEDLDISCTGIKGDGAKYFRLYAPPKLRCLRINNNKFISTDELLSLIRSCKKLGTIYMCGTTSIRSWRSIEDQYPRITFKHE